MDKSHAIYSKLELSPKFLFNEGIVPVMLKAFILQRIAHKLKPMSI